MSEQVWIDRAQTAEAQRSLAFRDNQMAQMQSNAKARASKELKGVVKWEAEDGHRGVRDSLVL